MPALRECNRPVPAARDLPGTPAPGPQAGGAPATDTVLVLDANQRSALAAIRSLGRRGLRVIAADASPRPLGAASRYCADAFVYPSPYQEPAAFLAVLGEEIVRRACGVALPMTDVTTALLARARAALPVRLAIPAAASLDAVNDKWTLYRVARERGLPVPRTERLEPGDIARGRTGGLPFPLVLKPVRSWTLDGERWVKGSVHYLSGPGDLARAVAEDGALSRVPYLAQEYIPGRGQGIFALVDRGRPVTFFAHRRLREKPPTGGVSVLSESVPVDPALRDIASQVLGARPWHGVAMVELKITPRGAPYLIEVNPRFWGSLQLAIDAGVDFPWLLYQLATGGAPEAPPPYRTGVRCRWLLGDVDALYLTLRSPRPVVEKLRAVLDFLRPAFGTTRHEINRAEDPRPALHELRSYLRALAERRAAGPCPGE